ncbi:MAG: hypothetical protein JEY79_16390 [Pseudodesulfovibrio sp.]|nr:hypothetical protein [Pseudodesulfovibrio sp.]
MLCALPIETSARELDGVLYLVLHLADRSLPCLIGERMVNRIIQEQNKPVIYFDIDQEASYNRTVLNMGGKVISIHPEGINMFDSPSILSQFTSIIDDVTELCVWGQAQADLVGKTVAVEGRAKVKGVGYPSFDLVKQKFNEYYEQKSIIDKHGRDYILINTNFSYGNNIMGFDKWIEMVSDSGGLDYFKQEQHVKFVHGLAHYQLKLIDYYISLANELSEQFPDRHIIFRPHPSENPELYKQAFVDKKNIFVTKEGGVRSWIASSGPVIHHDCTTGIEALLMGRTVINYRPVFEEKIAAPIPALAGVKTETPAQVVDLIKSGFLSEQLMEEQIKAIEPYFSTVNHSASQALAVLAASYGTDGPATLPDKPSFKARFKNCSLYLSRKLKVSYPDWFYADKKKKAMNALSKFPRLTKAEIEHRIEKLRKIDSELPQVDVKQLCLNTFIITPV